MLSDAGQDWPARFDGQDVAHFALPVGRRRFDFTASVVSAIDCFFNEPTHAAPMSTARQVPRPRAESPQPQIRERLLQAAHDLVAEKGLVGFKVIDVAARARANVAMINYHFGSRDLLLDEVVRLAAVRVASVRADRLERLLVAAGAGLPSLEAVLRCWLEPFFESVGRSDNHALMMLMVHTLFAADVTEARKVHLLDESLVVNSRFLDIIEGCVPQVPRAALAWRMGCAVGSCYVIFGQREALGWRRLVGSGARGKPSARVMFEELVSFTVAGVSAPPSDWDLRVVPSATAGARGSRPARKRA